MRHSRHSLKAAQSEHAATVATLQAAQATHDTTVASLQHTVEAMETRLATANNDKSAESEQSARRAAESAAQNAALQREVEGLRGQLEKEASEAKEKISRLELQLEEKEAQSGSMTSQLSRLQEELASCQQQLSDSELRLRDLAQDCDAKKVGLEHTETVVGELQSDLKLVTGERDSLSRDLDSVSNELAELKGRTNRQSDEEIENLHKQISNLSEENDVMKQAFTDRNVEFEELTSEVSQLREISETAFLELKKNEQQFTASVKQLRTTEAQLDDALAKVRGLQTKINDLEEELVRERSRANELEAALNSPPVMSFENLDNLSNISTSPPPVPSYVPNRVFCDNCDVFDDHETQDCPIGTSPGGVRHGGPRGLSGRPYCTVCEMFGHTAEQCEDDMTF